MEIKTKALGTVTIQEEQKLTFPYGVLGFEDLHVYALLDAAEKPFLWLQSLEDSDIAFLLVDPFLFRSDYEIDIDNDILNRIDIIDPTDIIIYSIVNLLTVTANLQGPIIINKMNNKALQAILTDSRWQIKHDIVAESKMRRT